MIHIPVLKKQILEYLDPKPNENFIDCTIGAGGHSIDILSKNKPNGKVLGIEIDEKIYQILKQKFGFTDRLILINDSYTNLKNIVLKTNFYPVNGIIVDLGMSSWHIEKSKRGFSFLKDEPLDMRYTDKNNLTAEKILNEYPEKEIVKILKEYGEERFSEKIAKKIVEEREKKPIKSTFQLIEIIRKAIRRNYHNKRIHFATRTFQALRIAVNDELNNLRKLLPQALEILSLNGRLIVISFHSLEDRIVKNFFKENYKKTLDIIIKKPIKADYEEIKNNPRSRSAKLRAAIKISNKI